MRTALMLIFCWLLAFIPQPQGVKPLAYLLLQGDQIEYGAAQLIGFASLLLTLYLANLGIEVVLRRRFQIISVLAMQSSWLSFIHAIHITQHALIVWLLALPFHLFSAMVLIRGLQAFTRATS